jgi:hypothetical protein
MCEIFYSSLQPFLINNLIRISNNFLFTKQVQTFIKVFCDTDYSSSNTINSIEEKNANDTLIKAYTSLTFIESQKVLQSIQEAGFSLHPSIVHLNKKNKLEAFMQLIRNRIFNSKAELFLNKLEVGRYINRPPPAAYVDLAF